LVVQPFTVAGSNVPDVDATVRALTEKGIAFTREGMSQDDLGVWIAPSGDRVAGSRIPTPTRSH